MKKDEQTIKVLQNQLEKSLKTLNDLQSENKNHRKEIDVCRKEQGVQDKVISGYNKEIKSITERVKTLNKTTQSSSKGSQDTNNQILALKAKHDLDKFNFEHRITDLQIKLQEKDED
jgi:NCAIR mutase (PurE)-related protein